ncbi:NAD(P)/FAD-dependent oxidoreductase [Lactococcus formosensis]|jgi:thioredoxin reductase|uniref:Ferredoxin--NADP reductase n=1 Tax=Lactococcus formosensis TaxID=1281486 RepID=A0A9Q8Y381_9LACT|nr:NAD(P)/FAD-dependent oxidoreductase [Lactococcus formosensis]MCH1722986.1 NAD(P)/FAD-dependent oxidoreductase [Lactococcus formosensis]MCO7180601.1 NAD(P)/FAD-dependent oxidoreductase [Lactococcus formosensis]MDG6112711.1 NAD(P)/FAD-dependent oxidoreductase [Lactococcus formosensis]MDG6115279.1 NAD(P)/FAD-dependent oxidoreductase [Lactococcus formosensis]MDG6119415.1 NAD(P)/FAD-dependent oxidoreductase [Lactococcus formosensis]
METLYDLTIIGAGPVGLYAGFYAGMRGMTVKIIEALEEAGGQPQTLYPDKMIYDIAGLPEISGADLTANLLAQLARVPHELYLDEKVENISQEEENKHFVLQTSKSTHHSKAVLLTTGSGLLSPRKLNLEQEEELHALGRLNYFIQNLEEYREKEVAVLGGGDSALDWALMLEKVASKVHLIHRRPSFRAHALTVAELEQSTVEIHTPYLPQELSTEGLKLQRVKSDELRHLEVDKILVNYGMMTNHVDLNEELELSRRGRITANRQQETNIAGLYVAGDASDYEGKAPLMSVGFGEAVLAINDMTQKLEFSHSLQKGHSSSLFGK